jgi:hypothetical protein
MENMRHHLPRAAAVLLLATAAALASDPPAHPLPPEPAHSAAITPEEFLWADAWLSDDARVGRETATDECREAARWIAGRMKAMGLEAPGTAPGHLLPWDLPGGVPVPAECALDLAHGDGAAVSFVAGTDFVVLDGSSPGNVDAPAVFAGFGIRAPDFSFDEYAKIDAKGKVVFVLRHSPREPDKESRWNTASGTRHKWLVSKVAAARAAGAAAVVIVNDSVHHDDDPLGGAGIGQRDVGIPVLLARKAVAEELLRASGRTPSEIQKAIDAADAPVPVDPGPLKARVKVVLRKVSSENVVGILRGSDPQLRDEWVVVGAHYDHVGRGFGGGLNPRLYGEIHNGADDNASGTAALLEVAESFALSEARPRRSILFAAFSGEEKGLLGSAAMVAAPPVPKESIVAMVNLDMVGRYRPGRFQVVACETGSTLKGIVDEAAKGLDLVYEHTNSGLSSSDGLSFYLAKIPTVFFFTGLHDDYHRPGDDWWLINAEGGAKVATLAARTTRALADADGRPEYKAVPRESMVLDRGSRVTLGVVTEDSEGGKGAVVQSVSDPSPAAAAGIKTADRIVSIAGREVKDTDGLRTALEQVKPGETSKVRLVRGSETLELPVTFPTGPGPVFGVTLDAAPGGKGVLVQEVAAGSVAETAGVKVGDRILSFGGKEATDSRGLRALLRGAKAGETVKVVVLRDGKEVTVEAVYKP